MEKNKLLVVVRVRGLVGIKRPIADTMKVLKLYRKNYCVLVPMTESLVGMVKKAKDYVTFGEIDEATLASLLEQRGRIVGNKRLPEKTDFVKLAKELLDGKKSLKDIPGLKTFFRLSPPRGGFERKGIKHPFSIGGVLGYRKDKINELVRKML